MRTRRRVAQLEAAVEKLAKALAQQSHRTVQRAGRAVSRAILNDAAEWGSDGSGTVFRPSHVPRPEREWDSSAWSDEEKKAWTANGVAAVFHGETDYDFMAGWGINAFQTAAGETIWVATLRTGYSFKGIPLFRQQCVGASFSRNEVVHMLMNIGFMDWKDYEARRHSWNPKRRSRVASDD